jgi:integrase
MSFHLFWPDVADMVKSGYSGVRGVPAIFQPDWQYESQASEYLRDRATLQHFASNDGSLTYKRRYPTRKSLETYGQNLCNFLEWLTHRGLSVNVVEYTEHIVGGYQAEMLSGSWSVRGASLKPRTVNLRVSLACDFLVWLSNKGIRPPFKPVLQLKKVKRHGRTRSRPSVQSIEVRVGAVRPNPMQLRLPTDDEIRLWRRQVVVCRGKTKLLMIDLILQAGIRREECACWRINTLPEERDKWRITGSAVTVYISHGTKGAKHISDDGEEHGPGRYIDLPLQLAERLDHYRRYDRPAAKAIYVRGAKDIAERRRRMKNDSGKLFLGEATGLPVSGSTLYEAWTSSELPFAGWSPHGGRHYYACKKLMDIARSNIDPSQGFVASVRDILLLHIQPQLGHVSEETTKEYLRWVERLFSASAVHASYAESLDALEELEDPHGT